jgi:hypothetical protein
MKKTLFFILGAVLMLVSVAGCRNEKSMQELIQEEKKAIDRYITRQGLNILNTYPQDGIFGEKDYYKSSEGVYYRVVTPGTDTKAVKYKTGVCVRVESSHYFAESDTSIYNLASIQPLSDFRYGITAKYTCPAWAVPLDRVGEFSVVDMIVPSEYGTSTDRSAFSPVFYKGVKYTFY